MLAVVLYVGLTFFLGSIVKAGVNGIGPKITKTKVALAGATISPLTGSGTLQGLVVGNPEGWSAPNAFALKEIHVALRPFSVLGEHVVIDEITIDGPEFAYETRLVTSNIKELLKNIEGSEKADKPAAEPAADGKPVKFVVKKFRLTNGKATLGVGATAVTVPLPPIALDDLGVAEGGITAGQLTGAVMRSVLGSVVSGTAGALSKLGGTSGAAAVEKTREAAKKAGEGLKKLFGDGKP